MSEDDAIPDASQAQVVEKEEEIEKKPNAISVAARISMFASHLHHEKAAPVAAHHVNTSKFRDPSLAKSAVQRCHLCTKAVYQVEELHAIGFSWHKSCFRCGGTGDQGCKRVLTLKNFENHGGQPYCQACGNKLFKLGTSVLGHVAAAASLEAEVTERKKVAVAPGMVSRRASGFEQSMEAAASAVAAEANEVAKTSGGGSARRGSVVDKFRDPEFVATSARCYSCDKPVYTAEQQIAMGQTWHKTCFVCGAGKEGQGCKRVLKQESYEVHANAPFCKSCYKKSFMGAGRGALSAREAPLHRSPKKTVGKLQPSTSSGVEGGISQAPTGENGTDATNEQAEQQEDAEENAEYDEEDGRNEEDANNAEQEAGDVGEPEEDSQSVDISREEDDANETLVEESTVAATAVIETKEVTAQIEDESAENEIIESNDVHVELEENAGGEEEQGNPAVSTEEASNEDTPANVNAASEVFTEPTEITEEEDLAAQVVETMKSTELVDDDNGEEEENVEQSFDGNESTDLSPVELVSEDEGFKVWRMSYGSDFDENGILHWLGTHGGTKLYRNPHTAGYVIASMSSVYRGSVHNICARNIENGPNYTDNALNSWCKIDFGPRRFVLPTFYTIRHGGASTGNALRNWRLQGKVGDTDDWITLRKHINDSTLEATVNASATFQVDIPGHLHGAYGFRYLRISQNDKNSSNNNCLFCCGLEFYGLLYERI